MRGGIIACGGKRCSFFAGTSENFHYWLYSASYVRTCTHEPKSQSLWGPEDDRRMFSNLMSLCVMPLSCRYLTALGSVRHGRKTAAVARGYTLTPRACNLYSAQQTGREGKNAHNTAGKNFYTSPPWNVFSQVVAHH